MDLIRSYRRNKQQTLAEVATQLEIAIATLHNLETGKRKAGLGLVFRIADLTKVPVDVCLALYGGPSAMKNYASVSADR